jgi:hypothetical protein
MFDGNIMGYWRIFVLLKGVERLGSKMLNVAEFMKAELFP